MYFNYGTPYYFRSNMFNDFYSNTYSRNVEDTSSNNLATAYISGGPLAPNIKGMVYFRDVKDGTEVYVYVTGLPEYKPASGNEPQVGPHGFHIHENGTCEIGNPSEPFTAAGGHFNPTGEPHGNHAGDFPVLFSNNGVAKMSFFTNKFKVDDIIGKAIIIHESPDDYKSQPAGNAGRRLACGVIQKVWCIKLNIELYN